MIFTFLSVFKINCSGRQHDAQVEKSLEHGGEAPQKISGAASS